MILKTWTVHVTAIQNLKNCNPIALLGLEKWHLICERFINNWKKTYDYQCQHAPLLSQKGSIQEIKTVYKPFESVSKVLLGLKLKDFVLIGGFFFRKSKSNHIWIVGKLQGRDSCSNWFTCQDLSMSFLKTFKPSGFLFKNYLSIGRIIYQWEPGLALIWSFRNVICLYLYINIIQTKRVYFCQTFCFSVPESKVGASHGQVNKATKFWF